MKPFVRYDNRLINNKHTCCFIVILSRESGKQDVQTTGDSANYQPSLFCGNTKHIDHVMVTINMACISFLKFVHLLDKFR